MGQGSQGRGHPTAVKQLRRGAYVANCNPNSIWTLTGALSIDMTHCRDDVVAAVRASFPNSSAETILSVLDLYGTESYEREKERVQLAVIALSEGKEDKLLDLVRIAKTDYRDVLAWYEGGPLTEEEGRKLQQAALRLIERWGKK